MKGVPEEQQDMIIAMVEKNPDFFKKMADQIKQKVKVEGKSEQQAAMEVMLAHQNELKQIAGSMQKK